MGDWESTPLGKILQTDTPHAQPNEPIEDVLKRMMDHSLSVIPVIDEDSDEFLGTVTSQDILDLVILMDEIHKDLAEINEKEEVEN